MEKMTNDLISRSELLKILREWPEHLGVLNNPTCEEYAERYGNLEALSAILGEVERLPAIDAVPVVRCGECKWVETCKACGDYLGKKGFCSRGKRMDGEPHDSC